MIRINLAMIFVDDQAKARAFYTDKLGFRIHTDALYSETASWLTVVSPDGPDGIELLLAIADDEVSSTFQRDTYAKGKPAIALRTDDVRAECKRLQAAGVAITMEPTEQPYGGIDAVFDDTCGNFICLHQE